MVDLNHGLVGIFVRSLSPDQMPIEGDESWGSDIGQFDAPRASSPDTSWVVNSSVFLL